MNTRPLRLLALVLVLLHAAPPFSVSETRNEADKAFVANDVENALARFMAAARTEEDPEDQAFCNQMAALLQWRYYQDYDRARERLLKSVRQGVLQTDLLLELARLELDRGDFQAASSSASRALLLATTAKEGRDARTLFAEIVVRQCSRAALEGAGEALSGKPADLEDARDILGNLVEQDPGLLDSSRLLLNAAILLGDGDSALVAWRSYFRENPEKATYKLLEGVKAVLEDTLPGWAGQALPQEETEGLIRALADSKLFQETELLATCAAPQARFSEDVEDILRYASFIRDLQNLTDEYYRKTSIGQGNSEEYMVAVKGLLHSLWRESSWAPAEFAWAGAESLSDFDGETEAAQAVYSALKERFGAVVVFDTTAGVFDLHMGHAIMDETRTVEQYGRTAELTFLFLDGVVSNGFQSWAWNYRGQHGGWAGDDRVVQVRPAYGKGPIEAWRSLTDPEEREKLNERITRDSKADDAIAENDPYAFFPGMSARLRLKALEKLHADLEAEGFEGGDLRTEFLARAEQAAQESSIFAHEGRHVIDKNLGITDSTELEFRAKLSEAAFAPYPGLAFSGTFAQYIGDQTPHGQASLRITKGLVAWMELNADQIDGLDRDRPLLPQFDLLSDEQIRSAVRSMDPLARETEKLPVTRPDP